MEGSTMEASLEKRVVKVASDVSEAVDSVIPRLLLQIQGIYVKCTTTTTAATTSESSIGGTLELSLHGTTEWGDIWRSRYAVILMGDVAHHHIRILYEFKFYVPHSTSDDVSSMFLVFLAWTIRYL